MKKRERMWRDVRQTSASHSFSCRLSVSTPGFLLLTGLAELCRFPNKETDKHLVWATPASVQREALLSTVLCGFPSFVSLSASSCPDHSRLDADHPTSATRSGFCLWFLILSVIIFLFYLFTSACTCGNINYKDSSFIRLTEETSLITRIAFISLRWRKTV